MDGLSVAENVYLGHEVASAGFSRRGDALKRTRELLGRLGHEELPPTRNVGSLSAAAKQVVSMARAMSHDSKVLIMDEPSAVLDQEEVRNLFRVIRELTREGVAIIYISHRLEEIREIGDRVTVLKDGRTVATGLDARATSTQDLIKLMTGRAIEYVFPDRVKEPPAPSAADVILSVRELALGTAFSDVSFQVCAGEIVGLAGLVGSGRSEILETIYGARKATHGSVTIDGEPLSRGRVSKAVNAGVGLCPEERKTQGLLLDQSVYTNITLSTLSRFARFGFLNRATERAESKRLSESLDVRPSGVERVARQLSGGNQQKVVLARWLLRECRLLLLDEPTRGVDVGARSEIYALVRALADQGVGILVVSSEIDEVLGLADRILVIREGRVVHDGPTEEIDEHMVLDLVMEGNVA